MGRQRLAKPLYAGSIPVAASKRFRVAGRERSQTSYFRGWYLIDELPGCGESDRLTAIFFKIGQCSLQRRSIECFDQQCVNLGREPTKSWERAASRACLV
jgi:hypothetical protein